MLLIVGPHSIHKSICKHVYCNNRSWQLLNWTNKPTGWRHCSPQDFVGDGCHIVSASANGTARIHEIQCAQNKVLHKKTCVWGEWWCISNNGHVYLPVFSHLFYIIRLGSWGRWTLDSFLKRESRSPRQAKLVDILLDQREWDDLTSDGVMETLRNPKACKEPQGFSSWLFCLQFQDSLNRHTHTHTLTPKKNNIETSLLLKKGFQDVEGSRAKKLHLGDLLPLVDGIGKRWEVELNRPCSLHRWSEILPGALIPMTWSLISRTDWLPGLDCFDMGWVDTLEVMVQKTPACKGNKSSSSWTPNFPLNKLIFGETVSAEVAANGIARFSRQECEKLVLRTQILTGKKFSGIWTWLVWFI